MSTATEAASPAAAQSPMMPATRRPAAVLRSVMIVSLHGLSIESRNGLRRDPVDHAPARRSGANAGKQKSAAADPAPAADRCRAPGQSAVVLPVPVLDQDRAVGLDDSLFGDPVHAARRIDDALLDPYPAAAVPVPDDVFFHRSRRLVHDGRGP